MTRVLSWNLGYWTPGQFNGLANRQLQWSWLLDQEPDIAFLQECRPEDLLERLPDNRGVDYSVLGSIPAGWTACSAILHRRDHVPVSADGDSLCDRLHGYVCQGVVIGGPVAGMRLASVHARAAAVDSQHVSEDDHQRLRRSGVDRAWHNDLIADSLEPWVGDRFIVSGDWNTARMFDHPDARAAHAGREFFDRRRDTGWVEAMRRQHDAEVRTWFRAGDLPYQLDHMFTDAATASTLRSIDVDPSPAEAGWSDHAPIVATFDLA